MGNGSGTIPVSLALGPGGVLYGATANGGSAIKTVFSLTPPVSSGGSWTYAFSVLPYYVNMLGQVATITPGASALYGTTSTGGGSGLGTVFSLTPPLGAGRASLLYNFTSTSGAQPQVAVTIGPGGVLYGVTPLRRHQQLRRRLLRNPAGFLRRRLDPSRHLQRDNQRWMRPNLFFRDHR